MTRRPAILCPGFAPAPPTRDLRISPCSGLLFLRCRDKMHRALSAELPIIAALYSSPYSRRAGHSREKTPGTLLPQCPALLPAEEAEEARAYPAAPVGSLEYASPSQPRFYSGVHPK